MEYRILLKRKVKVYGDHFHVVLMEFPKWDGTSWFQLIDVYDRCEHDRGIPYDTLEDAIRGFEATTGVFVSEELKMYLKKRCRTIN